MDLVQLLDAIRAYYGDTSRSREATREGLRGPERNRNPDRQFG